MRIFSVCVLLFTASAWAQAPVTISAAVSDSVQDYALDAHGLVEALLKVSAQFRLPLGVEWTKNAAALKTIRFSRDRATIAEIIDAVVSACPGYEWRNEDGIIHVFGRDVVKDSRNPLNITIPSFDPAPESVGFANNNLYRLVSHAVRHPEWASGIVGSLFGYPGEPVFPLAAQNVSVRAILDEIVTAGLATAVPRMQRNWIVTFPAQPMLSGTGFLEVAPVLKINAVDVEDQPFWILLPWSASPPEIMSE
jgi:hypothetical protein